MTKALQTAQPAGRGETLANGVRDVCLTLIPLLGVLCLVDVPIRLGLGIIADQYVLVVAGLSAAAAFPMRPYGARPGALEIALAVVGFACWAWSALNYADWLLDAANRPPAKWVPAPYPIIRRRSPTSSRRDCGTRRTTSGRRGCSADLRFEPNENRRRRAGALLKSAWDRPNGGAPSRSELAAETA
jgi:hypothetical protein